MSNFEKLDFMGPNASVFQVPLYSWGGGVWEHDCSHLGYQNELLGSHKKSLLAMAVGKYGLESGSSHFIAFFFAISSLVKQQTLYQV